MILSREEYGMLVATLAILPFGLGRSARRDGRAIPA